MLCLRPSLVLIVLIVLVVHQTPMTISVLDILLIMPSFMEDIIMSVLTAIFQAIAQAICWVLPISESGHSALFHDFANRDSGACSALTGIVHIGIAIGIVLSMYSLFFGLAKEFFGTFVDLFKKQIKAKPATPRRSFMYMTLISFAPMILWCIPTGKKGLLFNLLRSTGFNASVLEDGLFLVVTGVLVVIASRMLKSTNNTKPVTWVPALVCGVASVLLVPVSGLSLVAGVFAIMMFFGVSRNFALRYPFVIGAPMLVVMGIVEICVSVTPANIAQIIIGLVLSIAATFLSVRVLQWLVKNAKLGYIGVYDIAIGVIAFVIGIFELIIK